MRIKLSDLEKNTSEDIRIGSLKNFNETRNELDKFDYRNKLNELSMKEWIQHTKSIHSFNNKVKMDSFKSYHPAPFEEELPFYYIEFFSRKNEIVFDPFMGTGTSCIVSNLLGRRSIGVEINQNFVKLAKKRFLINRLNSNRHRIFEGDCYNLLKSGEIDSYLAKMNEKISFTITSPPYHDILKYNYNKKNVGIPFYRNYGNQTENLENIENYSEFLDQLTNIFKDVYKIMRDKSYLVINVKNYYRKVRYKNGRVSQEILFFAWDLAKSVSNTRWIPCGEQIWANPNKEIFPFGYPFVYLANITHSYNLIFYKDISKK